MLATFSLHSVVNDVGAYAGLASLIGLALLILLYFAQARELRRLSDWVEQEEERHLAAPQPVPRSTIVARGTPPPPVQPGTVTAAAAGIVPTAAPAVTTAVPGARRVAVPAGAGAAAAASGPEVGSPGTPPASVIGPATAPAGAPPSPGTPPVPLIGPATAAASIAAIQGPSALDVVDADQRESASPPGGADPDQAEQAKVVAMPVAAPRPPGDAAAPTGDADPSGVVEPAEEGRPAPDAQAGGEPPFDGAATPPPDAAPGEPEWRVAAEASARGGEPSGGGPFDPAWRGTADARLDELARSDVPSAGGAAPAAVPLVVRRIPIAEPSAGRPAGERTDVERVARESRATPPTPFDLLRADPPARGGPQADVAEAVPLGPSTAAGARPDFPPSPPVRVRRAQSGGEATLRAPARSAAPAPPSEPPRRSRRDEDDEFEEPPRSIGSIVRLLVAAVVIVAILIFVATTIFGGGSTPPPSQHTNSASQPRSAAGPAPRSVTVAVLNGTHTTHLASRAMTVLGVIGFRAGAVADAPSQTHATSFVGYTDHHRAAANEVARDLSLSTAVVGPVDAASLARAERSGRTPQVVVTLGGDYTPR